MRECKLGNGEHLEDVRAESALNVLQVNFCELLAEAASAMVSLFECALKNVKRIHTVVLKHY